MPTGHVLAPPRKPHAPGHAMSYPQTPLQRENSTEAKPAPFKLGAATQQQPAPPPPVSLPGDCPFLEKHMLATEAQALHYFNSNSTFPSITHCYSAGGMLQKTLQPARSPTWEHWQHRGSSRVVPELPKGLPPHPLRGLHTDRASPGPHAGNIHRGAAGTSNTRQALHLLAGILLADNPSPQGHSCHRNLPITNVDQNQKELSHDPASALLSKPTCS